MHLYKKLFKSKVHSNINVINYPCQPISIFFKLKYYAQKLAYNSYMHRGFDPLYKALLFFVWVWEACFARFLAGAFF